MWFFTPYKSDRPELVVCKPGLEGMKRGLAVSRWNAEERAQLQLSLLDQARKNLGS